MIHKNLFTKKIKILQFFFKWENSKMFNVKKLFVFNFELETRQKNVCEHFRISNSKCDVILNTQFCNSIL